MRAVVGRPLSRSVSTQTICLLNPLHGMSVEFAMATAQSPPVGKHYPVLVLNTISKDTP